MLDRLVDGYSNVLLRKVDIVDWDSAAAAQAQDEFGLEGIPYLRIYGTQGNLLGEVSGADIKAIQAAVEKEGK